MAGFWGKLGAYGGLGGAPGAYATNKNFRNSANKFAFGSDSEMQPFNEQSLNSLLGMLNGGGLENNALYGAGGSYLQNLFSNDQGSFDNFERPYREQFEQQTVPGIAQRFAGMGTGAGGLNSSALQQQLSQAGRGLQGDIASMREGLRMQALPLSYQYAQGPIQNMLAAAGLIPSQYYEMPGQEGFVQGAGKAFANGAGRSMGGGGF